MKKIPFFSFFFYKLLIFKSLFYLLSQDNEGIFWRFFIKNPLHHLYQFFSLFFHKEEKFSQGGYFFHGLKDLKELKKELLFEKTFLFLGFGYCLRPKACPSLRFSQECCNISSHPICNECLIGNSLQGFSSSSSSYAIIPTVFFLAKKILQIKEAHPEKKILFIITACPFSVRFFAPWAKFLRLQGLSLALSGPVCSAFSSFQESEKGKKLHSTKLQIKQKERLLELLALRKKALSYLNLV